MALSPEVWQAVERVYGVLPCTGQQIRCHLRETGQTITGKVAMVWLAMDEPVIDVAHDGRKTHVFPGLGDTWELA
jgi:hypothetical protein